MAAESWQRTARQQPPAPQQQPRTAAHRKHRTRKPASAETKRFRREQKEAKIATLPDCFKVANQGLHILCNRRFSDNELAVLSLGLKFILNPPNVTNNNILRALENFKRSVRIKKQFAQIPQYSQEESDLRVSNPAFIPDIANVRIERYLSTVESKIHTALDNTPFEHTSTPKAISQALNTLRNDKSIVIKYADKNLGTCVVDTEWYERTALAQLNDLNTYEPLNNPPNKEVVYRHLETILDSHNKLNHAIHPPCRTKVAKYLLQLQNEPLRLGNFYMTIKVHKTRLPDALYAVASAQ